MLAKRSLVLIILLGLSGLAVHAPRGDEVDRAADIARELDAAVADMIRLWPGYYTNDAQIEVDRRRGLTSWRDGGHAHIHSVVTAVDLPAVGDHLLYVEDYLDGDEAQIFRQKLYELGTDPERGAVVLTLHSFKTPEAVRGAHKDPALLANLTPGDLKQREGCRMYFRPLGDGYLGAFDYGACTTDTDMVADNRIFVAPGHYWFSDQFRPAEAPQPHATIGQNWHRLLPRVAR